ncbi:KIF-binding protein-like [Nematostella vectensis]|nr:KIF-binding protein-like [Nematostella vectensis]
MHKRRVDVLCAVLAELNPQHYLQICRQLMFETAEAYSEMVDLKIALAKESGVPPSVHVIKKINHLVTQSIKFFQTFIDSMKQKQVLPETYDDDIVRPALVSHFCVARLHGKIICSETRTKVDNLQKSLELYKYVVNYCDSHPGLPVAVFKDELEISREMTGLLPLKMAKIMAQSS